MNTPLISVKHLTHSVGNDTVLDDISCDIYQGDYIAIVGQNGSGKTTFISRLAGIEAVQKGAIVGNNAHALGYVPQFSSLSVSAPITTKEYLSLSAPIANNPQFTMYADMFGLWDIIDTQILDLSGGERQKVILLGELLRNPTILLLDEITSHIDSTTTHSINQLLYELHLNTNITMLRVTHNIELIQDHVSRVLCISNACIHETYHTQKQVEHTHHH